MKAFVKYGTAPYEAAIQKTCDPEHGDHDVILAVAGCGICGSDLHAYRADVGYEWVRIPVILGHEFAGTVISTGSAVTKYQKGDRVVVVGIQGCGICHRCRAGNTNLCDHRKVIGLDMDGGMAQYAAVHEDYLIPVPDTIDLEMAALVEPFSVAAHAMSKTVIYPEQRVIITGPGPIGLFCGIIAGLSGAKVLIVGTESDTYRRLPVARKLGLRTVNIEQESLDESMKTAFEGDRPDLWVEASGSPQAFKSSIEQVRRGGCIVIVGMYSQSFEWLPTVAVRAGYSIYFSYASASRDYRFALQLMAGNAFPLDPLVDFFPMEKAHEAFKEAEKGMTVKPVLITGE